MADEQGDAGAGNGEAVSEEQMRAAYEAELARITVDDVVVQAAVSLVNLAGLRLGGGSDPASATRDLDQVRDAIDAVRGLLPVLERRAGPELGPLRDALSRMQIAYAREVQANPASRPSSDAPPPTPATPAAPAPSGAAEPDAGKAPDDGAAGGPGPAESSGRLWVPGR